MSESLIKEGDLVIRGRDWEWGNQDSENQLSSLDNHKWCEVIWFNGNSNSYRMSAEYQDLIVIGSFDKDRDYHGSLGHTLDQIFGSPVNFLTHFTEWYGWRIRVIPQSTALISLLLVVLNKHDGLLTDPRQVQLNSVFELHAKFITSLLTQVPIYQINKLVSYFLVDGKLPPWSPINIDWKTITVTNTQVTKIINQSDYRSIEKIIDNTYFLRTVAIDKTLQQKIISDPHFPKKLLLRLRDHLIIGPPNRLGSELKVQEITQLTSKYQQVHVFMNEQPLTAEQQVLLSCVFCQDDIHVNPNDLKKKGIIQNKFLYRPAGNNCQCCYHLDCAVQFGQSMYQLAKQDRQYLQPNCLGCGQEVELAFLYLVNHYSHKSQWLYGQKRLRVKIGIAQQRIRVINQAYRQILAEKNLALTSCSHCQKYWPIPADQEEWLTCHYCQMGNLFQGQLKKQADQNSSTEVQSILNENRQPCPQCLKIIEKNGGCNHIKCTFCGYDFQWCQVDIQTYQMAHF